MSTQTNIALPDSHPAEACRCEVPGDLVETLVGGQDVVLAAELPFEFPGDINVFDLQLLQFLGDPFVEIPRGDAQPITAGLVVERHSGAVLDGPLEVVGGHVLAEDLPGDLVLLEERRSGEAEVARIRQRGAQVERQGPVLRPVRLVGHDDDIVPPRVRPVGANLLVELLDQGEDMRLVLSQELPQVFAAGGTARITVVVRDAAAGEGPVDLGVEIRAVREDQGR